MQADSRPRLDEKIGQDFLGLPGTNGPRWFEGGWPQFNIANFTLFGAPNAFQPNILTRRSAEAAYVATRATGQLAYYDRNVATVNGGNASRPLARLYGRNARTAQITGLGTYKYDSLHTRLEKRFASGFQMGASYTFSKNMGIAGNENGDGSPAIGIPEYYFLNRSRTVFDRTHNFQFSAISELPFGPGKPWANSGIAAALFGGWQINGILSMYSGPPFTVSAPGTSLNAPGNSQRADLLKIPCRAYWSCRARRKVLRHHGIRRSNRAALWHGGFNLLDSPGTFNTDISVFRRFKITERVSVQFRAEAFSATNTPHFSAPNGNANSSAFMEVSGVRRTGRDGIDERLIRFGLRLAF